MKTLSYISITLMLLGLLCVTVSFGLWIYFINGLNITVMPIWISNLESIGYLMSFFGIFIFSIKKLHQILK